MVVHAMAYPWIRLAAFVLQKSRTAALFNRHSCRLQHCNLRIVVRFELHVSYGRPGTLIPSLAP